MASPYFTQASFDFLTLLEANNNRDWFNEHKQQYEVNIRTPALDFIADMSYELPKLSSHFIAVPKKVGGSLMRVHRDVRFGKDKSPYKTNIGIQFRHFQGKDVHAPGYYLHIQPGECFIGVGIWRPDAPSLAKIRQAIDTKGKSWIAASQDKRFKKSFNFTGESLVNAPRGYAKEHSLLVDLKRKDFIAICPITESVVKSAGLKKQVMGRFSTATSLMKFLCQSLELNF